MNYIKHIFAGLLMVLLSAGLQAQSKAERKTQRKIERELKKEARIQALEDNHERMVALVENRTFVIEANTLYDRFQNRYEVSPTINFVKIDGDEGVVQFGFNQLVGYNGVGGLTFEGRISGYKITRKKSQGPITITTNISSPGLSGPATLNVTISNNGLARATIIGSFGSRITFAGTVYDLEETRVYQGQSVL